MYWYDETIDLKYEIVIQTNADTLVCDFLEMAVRELCNQNEHLSELLPLDGSRAYELCWAKKKTGSPHPDYPCTF